MGLFEGKGVSTSRVSPPGPLSLLLSLSPQGPVSCAPVLGVKGVGHRRAVEHTHVCREPCVHCCQPLCASIPATPPQRNASAPTAEARGTFEPVSRRRSEVEQVESGHRTTLTGVSMGASWLFVFPPGVLLPSLYVAGAAPSILSCLPTHLSGRGTHPHPTTALRQAPQPAPHISRAHSPCVRVRVWDGTSGGSGSLLSSGRWGLGRELRQVGAQHVDERVHVVSRLHGAREDALRRQRRRLHAQRVAARVVEHHARQHRLQRVVQPGACLQPLRGLTMH
jgi:hypothetical protein